MWRFAEWLLRHFRHEGRTYFVVEHDPATQLNLLRSISAFVAERSQPDVSGQGGRPLWTSVRYL